MKKIATIDLGTNGFRLYIAEVSEAGVFTIIHRFTNDLKIASDGFERIGDAPYARGLAAMRQFSTQLKQFEVEKVTAFGTAALRLAANGKEFIKTVEQETGIKIQLISGEREAELIYKGMCLGFLKEKGPHSKNDVGLGISDLGDRYTTEIRNLKSEIEPPFLMIDVGGGSVEFIIGDAEKVHWSRSFNVGVTILKQRFQPESQIQLTEIQAIKDFLNATCAELIEVIFEFQPKIPLIACGTLDFLIKILRGPAYENFEFSKAQFDAFYQQLIFLSESDLKKVQDIPHGKIEMLSVSFVLMDWIMQILNADRLIASAFTMKAGILYEMSFFDNNEDL